MYDNKRIAPRIRGQLRLLPSISYLVFSNSKVIDRGTSKKVNVERFFMSSLLNAVWWVKTLPTWLQAQLSNLLNLVWRSVDLALLNLMRMNQYLTLIENNMTFDFSIQYQYYIKFSGTNFHCLFMVLSKTVSKTFVSIKARKSSTQTTVDKMSNKMLHIPLNLPLTLTFDQLLWVKK